MLQIDVQSAPPVVTLVCSGRLVLGVEAETLRCVAMSRPEPHLLLDLGRVHTVDAAGLGLLVELHCWAQQRAARVTVANPSLPVQRLIALTSLDRVLDIAGSPNMLAGTRESDEWRTMSA